MRVSCNAKAMGRRQFVLRAGASLAALSVPGPLRASLPGPDDLSRLLGTKLPEPLTALLPQQVFEGASFIRKLMTLEAKARTLRLPPSKLSLGEGTIPLDPDRLYESALPRLVALIDRSELRNLGFADEAGELLALLNGTQHVAAEGWSTPVAARTPRVQPLGFVDQPVPDPGPILSLPPAAPDPVPSAIPPAEPVVVSAPVVQAIPEPQPSSPPAPSPEPTTTPVDPQSLTISRGLRFDGLKAEYEAWFKAADLRPEHRESAEWHLAMMRQNRPRYEAAGQRTAVPWFFIAAVHGMEASFNFRAHLHNGDFPLSQRTRQVPSGRPLVWLPPSDWESSAADALRLMGFAGAQDWSLARTLYRLEAFNGFGYRRIGRATPYLWSFSTLYDRGKFVADGHFNAEARSQQCGAGLVLKLLAQAGDIAFA